MTDTAPRRTYLGSLVGWTERQRVYRTAEALEVDASNRYDILRRRVFFDEVLLVTLHRQLGGGPAPLGFVVFALLAGLFGLAFTQNPELRTAFLSAAGLLGLLALAGFLLPSWVVTVYGRRARAQIRYRLRQEKARTVYEEICRSAAEAQSGPPPAGPAPQGDAGAGVEAAPEGLPEA